MDLQPGSRLGPYEIVSAIGRGGMGEVWKARDTRLKRDVAIKTSHVGFTGRFQKEAQAIAALNHPNICTLFDVGPDYLVMEFIEGETLSERMTRGPLPLEEALGIAKQIADALEAAHEKSIVHRDLKPANVKIRPDGSVKVLDFGLARAGEHTENTSDSPTLLTMGTQAGMILGTAGYMSPEQARGQSVDRRADIWAFGVVLWEMLTGARLFDGATITDSLAAILTKEPNLTQTPEKTRRLLSRCLEKDPKNRLRWVGDWQELLTGTVQSAPLKARHPGVALTIAVLMAIAAVSALAWNWWRPIPLPEMTTFEIQAPPGTTLPLGTPAVSPDGRTIVFAAANKDNVRHLYVRPLNSLEARVLPGTEGAIHPFFSPDGRSLGFAAENKDAPSSGQFALMRIDLAGGGPRVLAGSNGPYHGTWNQDGVILFNSPGGGVSRVSANGGQATELRGNVGHPFFLPDGKSWLSLDSQDYSKIQLFTLGANAPKLLRENSSSAVLATAAPDGRAYVLYLERNDLMGQQLNESSGQLTGEPVAIAGDVGRVARPDVLPSVGVSRSGTLAFQTTAGATDRLTLLDRSGKASGTSVEGSQPSLSPDGRFAAMVRSSQGSRNIWVVDLERGASTRLSSGKGRNDYPVWSPDGKRVAWSSINGIVEKAVGGTDAETPLLKADRPPEPMDWSPDGKYLLYRQSAGLALLPLVGDRPPISVAKSSGTVRVARFSPDGLFIAYISSESGRAEVYVRQMPPGTERWQVSTAGGSYLAWRRDGKELFYLSGQKILAVDVKTGSSFTAGLPHELFSFESFGPDTSFAATPDGQRFLIAVDPSGRVDSPIVVLQNWWVAMNRKK